MINVRLFIGNIRPLPESGRPTGIYKCPVSVPIDVGPEGFAGDHQADRRVHGGPEKAVHLYPGQHYARLAARFPEVAAMLVPGSMGENIATAALTEDDVSVGDVWRLGTTRLQVCQPRNPCWKIDERFGMDGMAAFIAEHHLTGWYWRVLTPGQVGPDDSLLRESVGSAMTLGDAMRLWHAHRPYPDALDQLAATPGIASNWQQKIANRAHYLRSHPDQAALPPAVHARPD